MSYTDAKRALEEAAVRHREQRSKDALSADVIQSGEIRQEIQQMNAQLDHLAAVTERLHGLLFEVLDQQKSAAESQVHAVPMRASPLGRTLQELNENLSQRLGFLLRICDGVQL